MKTAIFAAGCFWGVQERFDKVPGVVATKAGYTGGHLVNPTYEDICSHATGHAEAVEVTYDPAQVSFAELLDACWHYIDEQNGRSVTFEYVMLAGVNDSRNQARALAALLKGHPAKVNLIPFNPFPGTPYRRSAPDVIESFRDELVGRGVLATIRRTRGDDIDAACGQLAGRVIDRTTARLGGKLMSVVVQP